MSTEKSERVYTTLSQIVEDIRILAVDIEEFADYLCYEEDEDEIDG